MYTYRASDMTIFLCTCLSIYCIFESNTFYSYNSSHLKCTNMHSHVYDNRSYCIIMNLTKRKIKFKYIQLH